MAQNPPHLSHTPIIDLLNSKGQHRRGKPTNIQTYTTSTHTAAFGLRASKAWSTPMHPLSPSLPEAIHTRAPGKRTRHKWSLHEGQRCLLCY
ncbi:hypothetical protein AMTR_s00117p00111050 [Amborella trichopoda]|uniref:Uncharacterized protein n=1 Tax=Amborella trichopoda TaxID=13333 RepID=W1NSX5_AMBTC|nr:hypothetical protein AMTR_s00117p00111050 [Amborella trichopoda]